MSAIISMSSHPHPPGVGRSSSDSIIERTIRRESEDRTNNAQDVGSRRNDENSVMVDDGTCVDDVAIQTSGQGTLVVAARAPPQSSLASRILKAGQHLQLPSFQSLGISTPYPTNVLTPPEEHTVYDWQADIDLSNADLSERLLVSYPLSTKMPETPSTGDSVAQLSKEPQAEMVDVSTDSPSLPQDNRIDIEDSSAGETIDVPPDTPWLEQVVDTICQWHRLIIG